MSDTLVLAHFGAGETSMQLAHDDKEMEKKSSKHALLGRGSTIVFSEAPYVNEFFFAFL